MSAAPYSSTPDTADTAGTIATLQQPVSPAAPATLTREEVLALPGPQRKPWVESVRLRYPRWEQIHDAIQQAHDLNPYAAEPQCLMVTGPTGAGKSTLANSYAAQYPAVYTQTGVRRPVVQATVLSKATTKNLATMILYGLGDPRAAYGTEGNMTMRIIQQFKACGVEMLLLDEVQHFVDAESTGRVMLNASNWLKTVIKETHVACVLVGLQGDAEQVVAVNPQLGRLFGDPYVLEPFPWDENNPSTINEFRALIKALEEQLPLRKRSRLYSRDIAQRCHVACGGVVGYLMRLMRGAAQRALAQGQESINEALLAAAYDASLAPERRGVPNPFQGALPVPRSAAPTSQTRDAAATSNRSRARKVPKPTTRDLLG